MSASRLTNASEIAEKAGISRVTVYNKLKQGKSVDQILEEAQRWKSTKNQRRKRVDGESYSEAQLRKEIALANLRELELAQKSGELVALSDVNAFVSGMIVKARDVLLRIAPELRDRIAKETDPVKTQELIEGEVHRALRQLSEYRAEQRGNAP